MSLSFELELGLELGPRLGAWAWKLRGVGLFFFSSGGGLNGREHGTVWYGTATVAVVAAVPFSLFFIPGELR